MTDRTQVLTVVLDRQYRDDDVKAITDAISMIRGVIKVGINISDAMQYMNIEVAKAEIRLKLFEAVK